MPDGIRYGADHIELGLLFRAIPLWRVFCIEMKEVGIEHHEAKTAFPACVKRRALQIGENGLWVAEVKVVIAQGPVYLPEIENAIQIGHIARLSASAGAHIPTEPYTVVAAIAQPFEAGVHPARIRPVVRVPKEQIVPGRLFFCAATQQGNKQEIKGYKYRATVSRTSPSRQD